MSAAPELQPYPPAIPDRLPDAPPERALPQRRLCVVDYHLAGPTVRVPSRDADALAGHLHGWLYRLQGQATASHDADDRVLCDPNQESAPFAAWLIGDGHPSRRPGQNSVRVCWYSEDAAHRATMALARNPSAILGNQPYALAGLSPVTRQPVSAASLLERQEDADLVRLHTISPVTFRNHTLWHCSLDAPTVLGSALSRWLRLWPGTLPVELDAVHLGMAERSKALGWFGRPSISACEVKTEMTRRSKVETMALRGWAEWDLRAMDSVHRRQLCLHLLRGAELFGLGSRCAYGLGAIRVEVVR
jgi:hypothetical protein